MNREDERKYEELRTITTVVKKSVINMLGLNLMPMEDEETGLLRLPEDHESLPLIYGLGSPETVSAILKKREEYFIQEQTRLQVDSGEMPVAAGHEPVQELTPEELDEFMKGDIDFENDPDELKESLAWGSQETQQFLESLVLVKDDIDPTSMEPQRARTIGQMRRDVRKQVKQDKEQEEETQDTNVGTLKMRIESDSILANIPEQRRKKRITVETIE